MVRFRFILSSIVLLLLVPGTLAGQETFPARTHDFGLSAGFLFEGSAYFAEADEYSAHTEAVMVRIFYDRFIMEQLAFGVFGQTALTDFPRYTTDSGATLIEAGFSIKPRFFIGEKMAVKPGLNVGYRLYEADEEFVAGDGLGLNLGVEFQYDMGMAFLPFGEIGFLSQPWGGNEDTDITYDPILYLQVGIAL
jgi:hypothetical protein